MQHGGRHACFAGDGVQRRIGDPLAGKEVQGDIQQLFTAGGNALAAAWPTGAAGFRIVLLCWHGHRIS